MGDTEGDSDSLSSSRQTRDVENAGSVVEDGTLPELVDGGTFEVTADEVGRVERVGQFVFEEVEGSLVRICVGLLFFCFLFSCCFFVCWW